MKRYLLISFLVCCYVSVQAQSISFYDLTNIAHLNNPEAHNFLTMNRTFKEMFLQDINGFEIEHYEPKNPANRNETVVIGDGSKNMEGTLLHKVSYLTTQTKYILKFIIQAKQSGLKLFFHGADATKDIYIFNSFLYTVHVYINKNNPGGGSLIVEQNDVLQYD
jgi:hypothetical protein